MKQKLIITKGLPASGKTTWAKEQVKNGQGQVKRVNKDDLRNMVDRGKWSKEREKYITGLEYNMAERLLSQGFTVIVDDTNLTEKRFTLFEDLAFESDVEFEVKDFTDISLKECLKRNEERGHKVPRRAIKEMYDKHLRKAPEYEDSHYIICDVDGTLAHMEGRSPYDGSKVHTDKVDLVVRAILNSFDIVTEEPRTIIVTAREEKYKDITVQWLQDNNIEYRDIYFRKAGDNREDSVVKQEILDEIIKKEGCKPLFVLDDRKRVVDMWRRNGIKCLQVEEGDF